MAAQDYDESEGKKKRKRTPPKKLSINDKVEVRSMEEGFLGSWHGGTVVECGEQSRRIKYDQILNDDSSGCLVEWVKVSSVLDGLVPGDQGTIKNCRGNIRPLPPSIDFHRWSLHYGQCVDAFVQDAWWEGVIFDHEDGSDERKVFFPDMGDVLLTQTEMMRITQEWDEVTEEWKPRGNWLLLELIEEVEIEWPLLISVRQIWYEIRTKMDFEKLKEWTSSSRCIWKQILLQVLSASYKLSMKQILFELNSSRDMVEVDQPLLAFSEPALDAVLKPDRFFPNSVAIVPYGTNCQLDNHAIPSTGLNNMSFCTSEEKIASSELASVQLDDWPDTDNPTHSVPRPHEPSCVSTPPLSILSPNRDHISDVGPSKKSRRCFSLSSDKLNGNLKVSADRKRLSWCSAGIDMVPEAAYCPDSVTDYIKMYEFKCKGRRRNDLIIEVRKHISYLGWKIQFARDKNVIRMRYISPEAEMYYSLYQVCLALQPGEDISSLISQDSERNDDVPAESLISSPFTEKPQAHTGALELFSYREDIPVEPYYCPEAVVKYSQLEGRICDRKSGVKTKSVALKAKKHLSAFGWKFYREQRIGKMEMRYESPCGKKFYSLRTACQWYVEERELSHSNVYNCNGEGMLQLTFKKSYPPSLCMESRGQFYDDISKRMLTESSPGTSLPKQRVQLGEVKVHRTRGQQRKRKRDLLDHSSALLHIGPQNYDSTLLEEINESQASTKERCDINADISARVLRSSKRARQSVVSSSHQTPRTMLSWLIDSNVVLPRAKVHYRGKKDDHPMKEGKITREGIKCTCCQKVFTLSKFEAHAGSNYHRPSANIFLEDGRSLFDCQLQLKRESNGRKIRSEPHEIKGNRHRNDNICSVCHYGGELILCDKCPSSFHTSCLGLKEVPDGDWFCPSCCCGICGLSRLNEKNEQHIDERFLNCGQCEHQYHIGCLRNKGLVKLECYPEGNWFCRKRCQEIHLGLHNLLGKPIPTGHDNLTWTLLKYKRAADSDQNGLANEQLMECYSKLNVALSVMHECFEPVKESRTRRDLVEDVIFSRWSELNRLNFQGFYTVVLERDDELISVATVRVYGEKVAEIPLVATRFQYRRLGMCRILMNELEKKLMELGVERLVLPAVPSVLNTWETSFGFSRMKQSERLNFLDCTFLDFQGTLMCQKLLKDFPSTKLSLPTVQQNLCDSISKNDGDMRDDGDMEDNSADSDDRVVESEMVDQGTEDFLREIGSNISTVSTRNAILVIQPPEPENETPMLNFLSCQNEIALEYSVEAACHKESQRNNITKCYKRRKISTCGN